MNSDKPLDPDAAAVMGRVRRLMLLASVTTVVAIGAVLAVIGYRVFHWQGSASLPPAEAALPAGAKILSSAVGDGRIVLTIEINGAVELRSFDLGTLQPLGRRALIPARQ